MERLTIPAVVGQSAERFSTRVAVEDGPVRLTFAELQEAAERAAAAFLSSGVLRGDRVAIWAPNVWQWIVAALGAQMAGAALVPINTRFKGREAGYILEKSRARLLLTVGQFLGTDYPALLAREYGPETATSPFGGLPHLERVVLFDEARGPSLSWEQFVSSGAAVTRALVRARASEVAPDDLSDILFTSGTTGNPKGVMTAHAQNVRAFTSWTEVVGLREGDRYLIVNPFFHSFGYKAGWLACLLRGATILPNLVFDVPEVLARIARDRITVLPGPPTLYQSLLAHPDRARYELSGLRLAVTGAAVIPVELVRRMKSDLGFDTVITGYGLTEACGIATMCRFDDDPETIATTSGRAIADVEVVIRREDGSVAKPGELGEVVLRGYNVMLGYFEDPEQTRAAVDPEGWLLTGDIGTLDERGYLKITDRKKDLFITGGFNCYPAEIENALLRHPAIAQVAVVGVPDERLGEVGMAFVVLRRDARGRPYETTAQEILSFCRSEMANYKVPRHVEIVDALPQNASGKVLKYVLRERGRSVSNGTA